MATQEGGERHDYEGNTLQPQTYLELGAYPSVGDHTEVVRLGSSKGMLIAPEHLSARRERVSGIIAGYVAGHGGDVWWLQHDHGTDIGAYSIAEMAPDPIETSTDKVEPNQ